MAKTALYNMSGSQVGEIELADEIFGVEPNEHLVKMAVTLQLANRRQGTQSAKTRGEVRGGGKKPWRQKGTGHARQGSLRAPQFTGGGVVFAVKPRDYSFKLNRKEKRAALKSVLADKLANGKLVVVDELKFDAIKTKDFVKVMDALKFDNALVVLAEQDANVILSARNIPTVETIQTGSLNVYDMLCYDKLVLTQDAVKAIEEVYA